MNWKCPQCGADDNEESTSRCTCGYEPDANTFSIIQWVEPSYTQQSLPPYLPKKTKAIKIAKIIFTVLEIIALVVAVYGISKTSPPYIFPAACGAIFLFLGLEGIATNEVATRINLISKDKNRVFFYLMIISNFVFSALLFQHSLSLWAKP